MEEEKTKVENEMNKEMKAEKPKQEKDEVQITVTLECERKLHVWLQRINQGFDLGRVTRKHLATYTIEKMLSDFSGEDIQAVRQSTLTDFALLDKMYREAKASGVVPEALRDFLWKSMNLTQSPKRSKKSGQGKYSEAIHKEEGAA